MGEGSFCIGPLVTLKNMLGSHSTNKQKGTLCFAARWIKTECKHFNQIYTLILTSRQKPSGKKHIIQNVRDVIESGLMSRLILLFSTGYLCNV